MKKPPPPGQGDMFPTPEGEKRKALERVAANSGEWHERAVALALIEISQRSGQMVTGESLRHLVYPRIGEPHTPNAWGAVMGAVLQFDKLQQIGWTAPRDLASKASRKPKYLVK